VTIYAPGYVPSPVETTPDYVEDQSMEQVEMPFMPEDKSRTRFTTKAKKEAVTAIKAQILEGWDAPDCVWRLMDWLKQEIEKADVAKKAG
jgi:hypothetical protein